jgi:hypothetical protein
MAIQYLQQNCAAPGSTVRSRGVVAVAVRLADTAGYPRLLQSPPRNEQETHVAQETLKEESNLCLQEYTVKGKRR